MLLNIFIFVTNNERGRLSLANFKGYSDVSVPHLMRGHLALSQILDLPKNASHGYTL